MDKLWKSKAFWTALISTIGILVMRYTAIPEEVWQSIAALLATITAIFTVDDLEKGIGTRLAQMRNEFKQMREAFLLYNHDRTYVSGLKEEVESLKAKIEALK